jgi:hypothetical protein
MLEGRSRWLFFTEEKGMSPESVGDIDFEPHVKSGSILKYCLKTDSDMFDTRIYCLPTEEWRAKLAIFVRQRLSDSSFRELFSVDDLHRLEGTLLGYEKEDIELFVERSRQLHGR